MTDIVSTYADEGTWLGGNVHAHTTGSDGSRTPDRVIADYAARGYDFLAISDHDTFTDPAEYRAGTKMTLLPAAEASARSDDVEISDSPGMLHVGASSVVPPHDDRQAVVDAIRDDDGFAVPAHPNFQEEFAHWPQEELQRVTGYVGIEIYNGLIEQHSGSATATDRWDRLLAEGQRIWGFANDDSHRSYEVARGWNVVQVEERTTEAILDSLASGRFYASTGVTIRRIDASGNEIVVETNNADRIKLVSDHGLVQRVVTGPTATFRIPYDLVHDDDATYVRIECIGWGGEMAWTQPMFFD